MDTNLQPSQTTVNLTLTQQQYQIVLAALDQARAQDLAIREWTRESEAEITARYELPQQASNLNDMADAFFAQRSGVAMF